MARVGGAGGAANHPLLVLLLWLCATTTTAWAHVGGGGGSDADADAGADGGGAKPDLRTTKGVVAAKLWCQALVFAGALAGGVSPYFMRWNEALLVLGTRFAGGVFVCTGAIHFSDVYETLGDLLPGIGYQFAFMFMILCAGSILADCVISFVVSLGRSGPASSAGAGGIEEGKDQNEEPLIMFHHGSSSDHSVAPNASTLGDSVLLLAALCFNSVFEGIAIVPETKADAWKAPLTISLRKILAAIAMGIALLGMLPDRPFLSFFGYAFVFAISSPVGVGIGIAIDATTQGWVVDWIFAVSMGLAMAIFTNVYNNIFLSKGYKPQRPVGAADTPVARWLAFMLGFIVIVAVMIWDTR